MLIVISNPTPIKDEHKLINQLFDEGLEIFHVRKKDYPESGIRQFIEEIPEKYFEKMMLHSHYHLVKEYGLKGIHVPVLFRDKMINKDISVSFHSIGDIQNYPNDFAYGFLSPVFDSISKEGYKSNLDLEEVKEFLKNRKEKVIALGGMDEDKIDIVKEGGFSGMALLGAVWQSGDPVRKFKRIKEKWTQKEVVY